MVVIAYAREHPVRYQLLFNDPNFVSKNKALEAASFSSFQAFSEIVRQCQMDRSFRSVETVRMTGLIYATLHGAIDLELGGQARKANGLDNIEATVDLLLDLLVDPNQLAPAWSLSRARIA